MIPTSFPASRRGPPAGAAAGTLAPPQEALPPQGDLRRLAPFLRPYLPHMAVVALAALVTTAVSLAVPLAAKVLVDLVAVAGRPDRLPAAAGVLFALGVAAMAIRAGSRALQAWITARVLCDVRLALFRHMQRLSPTFYATARSGDLLSRLTGDVAEAQGALSDGVLSLALAVLAAVTSLAALCWLSWRLALVALLFAPGLALAIRWLRPRTLELARDLREQAGEAMSFLGEAIAGMAEIQAFGLFEHVSKRYRASNERFVRTLLAQQAAGAMAEGLPALFLGAGTLCVILLASHEIAAARMTWGDLVAFLAFQWRFHGPLRGIAALYLRIQRARVALARVLEIADLPPALRCGGEPVAPADPGDVSFDAVCFAYPGAAASALEGLTATIPGGAVTALVGPSGAGKSTALKLLLRLLEPAAGEIRAGGQSLAGIDGEAWRERIGLVGQETFLFHDTIAGNVRLARPDASAADVERALCDAGLAETLSRLPGGSATVVGERGARLSGGERQRVSLARALLREPALLILDEATAALDPLAEERVWEALKRRRQAGGTTLLVTHRVGTAQKADHVIVLERGRAVEAGPPGDLAGRGGAFAALLAAWRREPAEARP